MLRYVTSNPGKAREAEDYLGDDVEAVDLEYPEIQADDLAPIAAAGAKVAYDALQGEEPVIVDDAGLFIDSFDGFPGPYSAYVENTIGVERVGELARGESNQSATFRCVIAFTDGTDIETFEGIVRGRIVEPRGEGGFGYDPIFAHGEQTFAEMETAEKNAVSHRGRALERFSDWYAQRDRASGSRSAPG